MLGSKKGMRDIRKGVNDIRSGNRQMKIAFASPAKKVALLAEERDTRLAEADTARKKAYGWGAKKFIQVAERAEHEAAKADEQIAAILAEHPELTPTRTRGRWERMLEWTEADAESKKRYKSGQITKEQYKAELEANKARSKEKIEQVALEQSEDSAQTVESRLKSLDQMFEAGVITEQEYTTQRQAIISEI